ncbi:DUF1853 family protein [Chitinimonas lacunae]|uniref:DUF1853 family protein n=1 Tax=Chitinimonas lacunae TaxID=1963018 RepID=A0ABV8MSB0_9NEIS
MQRLYAEPASLPDWLTLEDETLRDLAWLLTGPTLPVSRDEYRRYLPSPQLGQEWWQGIRLSPMPYTPPGWPASNRLGHYAEALFGDGLRRLPAHRLLLCQHPIREQGRSIGEFDFVLERPDGGCWHIELTVKFYLGVETSVGHIAWVGPGLRDNWARKEARLFGHQLPLADTAAGQAALAALGVTTQALAWLRGRLFLRAPPLNDPLYGWWRRFDEEWPQHGTDSGWRILARRDWMAPRQGGELLSETEVRQALGQQLIGGARPLLLGEYDRASGSERSRGFVVPTDWPRLAALYAENIS